MRGALALMRELGAMGEGNLISDRRKNLSRRGTLLRAAEILRRAVCYRPRAGVIASFETVFLHGWAPHASQPKPLRPGSAQHRLAEALALPRSAPARKQDGSEPTRGQALVRRDPVGELEFFFGRLPLFFHLVTIPWIISLLLRIARQPSANGFPR